MAEILVVMLIIGLMSGAVIMTRPKPKAPEITQAETLSARLGQAMQTTIITGQPSAFGVDEAGYGFYLYENGQWSPTALTGQWGSNVGVSFTLEGQSIELPDVDSEAVGPQILLEPIGQMSVFNLTLTGDVTRRVLMSDGSGKIRLTDRLSDKRDE